jgi:transcriptional regulator with XRE-family HTH domain
MATASTLISSARRDAGMTQAQLASVLDTTQSAVARLESAGANPRLKTLERVMEAMGQRLELSRSPLRDQVDETMVAANLELSPAQRLLAFDAAYRNVRDLSRAARPTRG